MASKFLSSLSKSDYELLTSKLLSIQSNICFICQREIDLQIHDTNIDHIVPLANRGKDSEENFAVTHEICNKSKLDSDLKIARILHKLKAIQEKVNSSENKAASLKHILMEYGGAKYEFKSSQNDNHISYSWQDIGKPEKLSVNLVTDALSHEKTFFVEVPIEYIFHDEIINPRGINNSISKLIKEFDKGNPQLHLSLARIDDNKIKIFDGQHKAVAQILLGVKSLLVRVFPDPDVDRLIETNTNAGSTLRQIAFDKSILRQLNSTLYTERIAKYQQDHSLLDDNYSFSELQLIDYFKGDNIKKYIIDNLKNTITYAQDNKLKDYIDFEGKSKELPVSHSAYDKTFLSIFTDSKLFLNTNINYRTDEGLNPRELEISQLIRLQNIIAEEIYVKKFIPEIGVSQIEKKIVDKRDNDITDDHLIAYRMSKEEIMYNWLIFIKEVINNYFSNTGKVIQNNRYFQNEFDEQLWVNITNFVRNLRDLPLWKDRSMSKTIFSGKSNYDFWKNIFETGKTKDNVAVMAKPINFVEMIKRENGK
jgi:hypothetical protein